MGHHSGIRSTLRTRQRWRALRRSAPVTSDPRSSAFADRLHAQGYLLAAAAYPQDLIDELRQVERVTADPATSVAMGGRNPEAVRYGVDPLSLIPRLREFLTPELAAIVRAWYGTEFRIASVRLWRIAHVPPTEQAFNQYGNLWHVDGHAVDALKMFVQVTPCAEADAAHGAALRLVSRRHTRLALLRGYVDQRRILPSATRFLEKRVIMFDGPPGSVLFANTNRCLHRAGNPPPGVTRAMAQFYFLPSASPPPDGDYFADVPVDANVYEGAVA